MSFIIATSPNLFVVVVSLRFAGRVVFLLLVPVVREATTVHWGKWQRQEPEYLKHEEHETGSTLLCADPELLTLLGGTVIKRLHRIHTVLRQQPHGGDPAIPNLAVSLVSIFS